MNKEIKDKWLTALRSGEYKKSKHNLKTDDGFCCLGVLCDLYRKETGKGEWNKKNDIYEFEAGANSILPVNVWKWAELTSGNPKILGVSVNLLLSQHNDFTTKTFEDIADLIETDLVEELGQGDMHDTED